MTSGEVAQLAATIDESKVTPGTIGFLVIVALGIALWLLLRSMNRQLHKIDFEESPETDGDSSGPSQGQSVP
jgi:hypothetical protein